MPGWAWAILVPLAVLGLVVGALNLPPVSRSLGRWAGTVLSEKTGREIQVEAVHLFPRYVLVDGITVVHRGRPALSLQRTRVVYHLRPLLHGELIVRSVDVDGFTISLPEPEARNEDAEEAAPKSSGDRLQKLARFLDPGGFEAHLFNGRIFWGAVEKPLLEVPLREARVNWLVPGSFPIETMAELGPYKDGSALTLMTQVRGREAGASVQVRGPGVSLEHFRTAIDRLVPPEFKDKWQKVQEHITVLPAVGGDFTADIQPEAGQVRVDGQVRVSGLTFVEERVASVPIGPINLAQDVSIQLDAKKKILRIDRWLGQVAEARYTAQADLTDASDGLWFSALVELNQTPYQALLEAVPANLRTALKGVRLGGTLDLSVRVQGNIKDMSTLKPEFSADWRRLKLELPSEPLRTNPPLQGFIYRPFSPDGIVRQFAIGRGTPGWVSLDQVPEHLVSALVASEDITFFHHQGFDSEGLRLALETNLKAGKALRGGSTITQQLAKNLFLTREKTAIRKLQEAVLAWELEQVLTKRQILEYYLNIIEWGPDGLYGIGKAAQHYFGKAPYELTIREAVFLCSVIPNPIRYYVYFQRGELTERWNHRVQATVGRMRHFDFITEEQYLAASAEWLAFRGSPRAALDVSSMELQDEAEEGEEEELPLANIPLIGIPEMRGEKGTEAPAPAAPSTGEPAVPQPAEEAASGAAPPAVGGN